jgi:hypothetical protein
MFLGSRLWRMSDDPVATAIEYGAIGIAVRDLVGAAGTASSLLAAYEPILQVGECLSYNLRSQFAVI